ncbi:MAG: acetyl-CoA carboxylase carboxyltransferase subunit alpha [Lachnospiraceae bacterium]|nr:acetyl-CoA carboxylase carboxyltransferase subunit alpha [Lachnospiraceae bacterium]
MLSDFFKKTPKNYVTVRVDTPKVPAGLLRKCKKCNSALFAEDVRRHGEICPKCGAYFRMRADQRIALLVDKGSFRPAFAELPVENPLHTAGYEEKLARLREKTGLDEAVVTGFGTIGGIRTALGVCDGRFLMASMGRVVGEKIVRLVERATAERLPVVLVACSGGARMQEGIVSLMQMVKTSQALRRHGDAGQLFLSVLTDPTTGGVTASFAMLGDVIVAEPEAMIGFAGPRVIEQTIGQKLPKGFQSAEYLLEHGFLDQIVPRNELRGRLETLLRLHGYLPEKSDASFEAGGTGAAQAAASVTAGTGQMAESAAASGTAEKMQATANAVVGKTRAVGNAPAGTGRKRSKTAWERVLLSRDRARPVGEDYIQALFTDFCELHGDRRYGDDAAVIGGVALFHGRPVTVIAQMKGRNTKDSVKRNFGMPSPEGYRKAKRLMEQAEKFRRPVICFVDTPGAFCGLEAEARGQGQAIAENLFTLSGLRTPVLSIVIGEGGSGGALALAVADEVWLLENSIYSILSPEGYASILWKDSKRAQEAAQVMKITAADLLGLGVVERVFSEPEGFCRETMGGLLEELEEGIAAFLESACKKEPEQLIEERYARFRKM